MTAEPLGPPNGVDERVLQEISSERDEPDWLLNQRVRALRSVPELPLPAWWLPEADGAIDQIEASAASSRRWGVGATLGPDPLPVADTAAAAAQEDAERVFYGQLEALERVGVVFCDLSTAVAEHGELVRQHLGTLVGDPEDKLGALTEAIWSGGAFLYVPPRVQIDVPLQSYARIRSESPDRFERTLIVAGEGARVHYIEGCASPVYSTDQVRGAAIEIVVGPSAEVSYTAVQNWSANVAEVTRTAAEVHAGGQFCWTAGNIGARRTVRRLNCLLSGKGAAGVARTISYASNKQLQDVGIEMVHAAPDTHSEMASRSVVDRGGQIDHGDRVVTNGETTGSTTIVRGDGLTLTEDSSVVHTVSADPLLSPATSGREDTTTGEVTGINEESRFYLMSRGLSEQQTTALLVNGFINPVIETLPTEYAVEWTRLIELQIEGAIG